MEIPIDTQCRGSARGAHRRAPVAQRRSRRARGLAAIAAIASLSIAATLGAASTAAAAGRPFAGTGGARDIGYATATLAGSVNPQGSNTSYYFQYGPTRAYGAQSAIADAGSGTRQVRVSLPVSGLQPITRYHYRLVAVNTAGATLGADRTFMTSKVPLSLQILAAPNPIAYGGTLAVQGTLSGTDNGYRPVVLQANPFPFTTGFQTIGNPELTSATGGFSFPVVGLVQATQFRVLTNTNPPVISPVALENVTVRVSAHIARTRRRHYARFYGTVVPAQNGMQVGILRITHGRGVLAGGTVLRPRNATSSSFSRVVHVRPGIYRVLVRVTSGPQSSSYSTPLRIG
jgi:hypothetical protein